MRDLTIPEWGELFSGRNQSATHYKGYRSQIGDMLQWTMRLQESFTAKVFLEATEDMREFFTLEEDMGLVIPKPKWEECFFSLKNGFSTPDCPAKFIYMARKAYEAYGMANLIGPALPRDVKSKVNYVDYFGAGYTAKDAICNFVLDDYRPITVGNLIVKCGDWYEAYIADAEMVVALPISVGKRLSSVDIQAITLDYEFGLMLHDVPLYAMCGMKEVPSNIYDLRGVL